MKIDTNIVLNTALGMALGSFITIVLVTPMASRLKQQQGA